MWYNPNHVNLYDIKVMKMIADTESKHSNVNSSFKQGLKKGLPICLGYIPVSFTFGLMAVDGGLPSWFGIFISATNLTSAGQFAGLGIILQDGSLLELGITTFIINLRYMLMSLSLSQKIDPLMSFLKRAIISFGITDEIFAVASLEVKELTFRYMLGLMTTPILGWTLGTTLGALISSVLPPSVQNAMGIALYAMFIAIVIPMAKISKQVSIIVIIAILFSSLFAWSNLFINLSGGWKLIITTVIASSIGAYLFPREDDEYANE